MEGTLALKPGDLLVLYTDGLIEAQAPGGEMFELERLTRAIMAFREDPVEVITGHVYEQVGSFLGTGKLQDDLTFVTMRVKPKKDSYMVSFPCRRDLIPGYGSKVVAFLNSRGFGTRQADQLRRALAALLASAAPASAQASAGPDRLVHLRVTPSGRSATLSIRSDSERDSGPCFSPGSWTPLVDCGGSIDRKEAGNELTVTFEQDGVIQ
jgi:hypothetical protein